MIYSIFNENDWLFPDSEHNDKTDVVVDLARNGHSGFSILGDTGVKYCVANININWKSGDGPIAEFFEMKSVNANKNNSDTLTAANPSECADFVTKNAPLSVYDALGPLNYFKGDRFAVFCELYAPESLADGIYEGEIYLSVKGNITLIPIFCTVHRAVVPRLKRSRLSVLNLCSFENIATQHAVKTGGKVYVQLYKKYVDLMLKLRCTHIPLPPGEPIYDKDKKLVGFDFSLAQMLGKIAVEKGAPYLTGASIAIPLKGHELEYCPFWDLGLSVLSSEGYLQLKLYLLEWAKVIKKNRWEKLITQALATKPLKSTDATFGALSSICRRFLPGVKIIEMVEGTNHGGGVDIRALKIDTFENNREEFEKLKQAGEEFWFYTCGASAEKSMNRTMNLPLAVSRIILWMGFGYGLTGFLHDGFNCHTGSDILSESCCSYDGNLSSLGDGHIVYPEHYAKSSDDVLMSVRLHAQRCGAEDYELFSKLYELNPSEALEIQGLICTSFCDYTGDGASLSVAQKKLLTALDQYQAL